MRMQQGFSVFIINWGEQGFKAVDIGRKAAGRPVDGGGQTSSGRGPFMRRGRATVTGVALLIVCWRTLAVWKRRNCEGSFATA